MPVVVIKYSPRVSSGHKQEWFYDLENERKYFMTTSIYAFYAKSVHKRKITSDINHFMNTSCINLYYYHQSRCGEDHSECAVVAPEQ